MTKLSIKSQEIPQTKRVNIKEQQSKYNEVGKYIMKVENIKKRT